MATTIDKKTKERSADYKLGDWTYDEVLQLLMDNVSPEDVIAEHVSRARAVRSSSERCSYGSGSFH
ncbi:MAG: hypothetical protein R6U17_05955, partial [Thermoplasmata archaeon]